MLVHQCKVFWSNESSLDKNTSVNNKQFVRSIYIKIHMKCLMNILKRNFTNFLYYLLILTKLSFIIYIICYFIVIYRSDQKTQFECNQRAKNISSEE